MKFDRKISKFGAAAMAVASALMLSSCGSSDDDDATSSFLPTIDFSVPDEAADSTDASLALMPANSENRPPANEDILLAIGKRVKDQIDGIQEMFERWNSDGVDGVGEYAGLGPDGNIGIAVSESSDADYEYVSVVCLSGTPFAYVQFKEDGSAVSVVLDQSAEPQGAQGREGGRLSSEAVARIIFSDDGTTKTLSHSLFGEPRRVPADIDDTILTELISATIDTDEVFQVSVIGDWGSEDDADAYEADPDNWLIGQLSPKTSGEGHEGMSIGYRSDRDECAALAGDEPAEGEWCLGRVVGSDEEYTDSERDDAFDTLSSIAVLETSDLEAITFPDDLADSCPSS